MAGIYSETLHLNHCQYCVNCEVCEQDQDYLVCDEWNIDMFGEPCEHDECLPPAETQLDAHQYMELYGE